MKPLGELLPTADQAAKALAGETVTPEDQVTEAVMVLAKDLPVFLKDKTGKTGRTGPDSTYKYFTLDQIMHKLRPVLFLHGFILSHTTQYDGPGCYSFVTQLWYGGEAVREARCPFTPHADPKKLGSQLTYYRRYTACMLFAIVADKDDDGAAAMEPAESKAAIDELSLFGDVASMSEQGQDRLQDELTVHAKKHSVSRSQVVALMREIAKDDLAKLLDLTTGQVNSLFCEIEDRSKGS